MSASCPFCCLPPDRIVDSSQAGFTVRDAFPISPGHTLIVSSRHVDSLFDLTTQERDLLLRLVENAKLVLDREYQPDAYNIGINDGIAAGQTVPHLHIHLIPRFAGDVPDPRGGVRWVIPEKADYWSAR
jgi:diadenosine tetraphosphate (Ap4A) HIT family hydrolase